MLLFKNPNEVIPCNMFSIGHAFLLIITIYFIHLALKKTKNYDHIKVHKVIKKTTIILWTLEIIKIIYSTKVYGFNDFNRYIPLYFCSLILYAGLFSSFAKNTLKHVGDVFLSTGSIVAGMIYLISPLTSLTTYPFYHFITFQSFFLHGSMIYLGLLMQKTKYISLERKDFKYYTNFICSISLIALIVNAYLDSNLMFISKNYPGTFIEIIYNSLGPLFPSFMIAIQATLPFIVVFKIQNQLKLQRIEKALNFGGILVKVE